MHDDIETILFEECCRMEYMRHVIGSDDDYQQGKQNGLIQAYALVAGITTGQAWGRVLTAYSQRDRLTDATLHEIANQRGGEQPEAQMVLI